MGYQLIAPIDSVEPRPNLLTTTRRLPAGVNWRTGVTFRDTGAHVHGAWPYFPASDHDDKLEDEANGPRLASFLPVLLYVPLECDELTMTRADDLVDELTGEIEASSAMQLARTLASSNGQEWVVDPDCAGTDNPTLSQPYPGETFAGVEGSSLNAVVGSAGMHPVPGLAALLDAYTAATLKGGATLHVEARILPHWIANGIIDREGDVYRGPLGSVVVPHAELVGPAADDAGAPDAPAAGNAWVYVTGPVETEVGEVVVLPEDVQQRWRGMRRTNQWAVLAERLAIYRFNPSVVFAAEVLAPVTGV